MNDLIVKDNIKIEDLIYEVRGKQVILDSDLARLYGCKNGTKEINQAVRNNIEKFPERYSFRITEEEYIFLKSKFLTSKGGSRKGHTVFTEQGVYMLATIIKSKIATEVTIAIMDAFVIMKNFLKENNYNFRISNVESKIIELDNNVKILQKGFDKLSTKEEINHIFYEGQIYDAYDLFMKILSESKKEIIIIDNYAGRELFNIIKDIKVKVKVYTKNIDNIAKTKYEEQYSNIEIITTDTFHDRFILIDKKILYHSGASFKDIGKKCFSINKIEDTNVIRELISRLEVTK